MTAPRATYQPRKFNLSGLKGISDKTLEMHFKLYEGYVKQTNVLNEQIAEILKDGKIDQEEIAGLLRAHAATRLRVQRHGPARVLLREPEAGRRSRAGQSARTSGGCARPASASWETWKTDFVGVGKMRGVGWAICYQDPHTRRVSNHWITLHEVGNVSGFHPLLVMDVWEHAFLLDYPPADRPKYIEAFFANVDWEAVEQRL